MKKHKKIEEHIRKLKRQAEEKIVELENSNRPHKQIEIDTFKSIIFGYDSIISYIEFEI